jgi:hypothetical protein
MKRGITWFLWIPIAAALIGCRAEVETTDDSHQIEVEVPKVDVGDEPVDLDPATDDDVDVDTPAPGDT